MSPKHLVTLGMFIVDEFSFKDSAGNPTGRTVPPQIGGGGTYAAIGARIWLSADEIGMIVDKGDDWDQNIQTQLESYGESMWSFREHPSRTTTRALNAYVGETRHFQYLTPRIRLTPIDLVSTPLAKPTTLHFICSPTRALAIIDEIKAASSDWNPVTIYEPIPDRCIPEELPSLKKCLPDISILSPNAEEALSLLSMSESPSSKASIEKAASTLMSFCSKEGFSVIVRSGPLGAYVLTSSGGRWIPAYWDTEDHSSQEKVVDVTGAGNSFLGGLSAGLKYTQDVFEAALYATVSASFVVEQQGLPLATDTTWNKDSPQTRLDSLRTRL